MANTIGVLSIDLIGSIGGFESSMRKAQNVAQRTAGTIDKTLSVSIRNTAAELTRLAGVAGVGLGVTQVIKYADSFTELQNRLRLVTKSQEELKGSTEGVYRIAQTTSQSMDSVGQVYQRIAQNADALGLSLSQVEGLTEKVAKAVAISGASASTAAAGLTQFGQALASGVLRGDEFNSIMENLPGLAQAIATGLNVPIGALRAMAKEGQLTAETVVNALDNAGESIETLFGTRVRTVAQAMVELENAVGKFFGELNQGTGASGALVSILSGVAHNLDAIVLAGTGFAGLKIAQAFSQAAIAASNNQAENIKLARSEEIAAAAKLKSAQNTQFLLKADLERARAATVAAEAEAQRNIVAYQGTVATIQSTQAQLAAEIELATQQQAAATTDKQRAALMARITALRSAQVQVTKQLKSAEIELKAVQESNHASVSAAIEKQRNVTKALADATLLSSRSQVEATAATRAYEAAQRGLSVAAGLASKALSLVGGPLGLLSIAAGFGYAAWKSYRESVDEVNKALTDLSQPLDQVIEKFGKMSAMEQRRALQALRDEIKTTKEAADEAFANIFSSAGVKQRNNPLFQAFVIGAEDIRKAGLSAEETDKKLTELYDNTLGRLGAAFATAQEHAENFQIKIVKSKESAEDLSDRLDIATESVAKVSKELQYLQGLANQGMDAKTWDEYIGKLTEARDIIGMNARELAEYKAAQEKANDIQIAMSGIVAQQADEYKKLQTAIQNKDKDAEKAAISNIQNIDIERQRVALLAQQMASVMAAAQAFAKGNISADVQAGIYKQINEAYGKFALTLKPSPEIGKQIARIRANTTVKTTNEKKGGGGTPKKSDEEKQYEREQKQFKDWIKNQKEKIALLGTETELEKINAELKLGNWSKISGAQKEEMRQIAALVDLEEKRFELMERSKELSGFNTFKDNAKDMEALADAFGRGALSADSYNRQLMRLGESDSIQKLKNGFGDASDMLNVSVGRMLDDFSTLKQGAAEAFGDLGSDALDGFSESIGRAIVYSEDFGEAIGDLGKSLAADLISNLVKLGVQYLIFKALGESMGDDATKKSIAQASETAAAWAPAAAAVSLASFGSNGFPATAAIIGTNLVSMGFAKAGFAEGGFTGQGNKYDPAGIVHAGEYVFNAQRVREIGLDNLRRLDQMGGWADGGYVANSPVNSTVSSLSSGASTGEITVNTYTSKALDVKQGRDENGNRIIEIRETLDAVAAAFSNPNSNISRSLNKNFKTKRTF